MQVALDSVSCVFGATRALDDISLTFGERRLGIIGANGSGKSTFVRLLNGLALPTAGRVCVDGLDVGAHVREVRKRIGFVFQNPDHQIVMPLVAEDVAFGLKNRGLPRAERQTRAAAALERFGLEGKAEQSCHTLSGGDKQMLALAGIVAAEPDAVVLDEPTALLDLRNRNAIRRAIADLDQSVVLATHDLELVEDFDRVLVFDRGRIIADGPPNGAVARYRESIAS